MRIIVVILTFVIAIFGLFLGVKAWRDATTVTVRPGDSSSLPSPSRNGPHPKAVVVGGTEYDFGIMEQGQESEHIFMIRNDGEAPLRLAANYKGANTCECTIGKLAKNVVEPGQTVQVTVAWGVKKPAIGFAHSARIRTNDPELVTIPFLIKGVIGRRAVIKPSPNWSVGRIEDNEPVEVELTVHSEIADSFKLLKIENPSGALVTSSRALDAKELLALAAVASAAPDDQEKIAKVTARLKAGNNRPLPKAGYKITATVDPSKLAAGPFLETLIIHTDLSEEHEIRFRLSGTRSGMIEFLTGTTSGAEWNSEKLLLKLGSFSAAKGKSVRVPMLIKDVVGDSTIQVKATKPKFLKVELERDENFPAKQNRRYWMTLTVPKGQPPVVLTHRRRGIVSLELVGDTKRSMRFFVGFVSR
jgi:hypothetical protein